MWLRQECGVLVMEVHYISKLLYQKYTHKITFQEVSKKRWKGQSGFDLSTIPNWCATQFPHADFKCSNRYQHNPQRDKYVFHVMMYLTDPVVVDALIKQFPGQVVDVWKPLDDDHVEDLAVKNVVEVRNSLYYKKYRFSLVFNFNRARDLYPALEDYFRDNEGARVSGSPLWPRLYLTDKDDLTVIKLMWGDRINYIKSVRLMDEPASVIR